MKTVTQYLPEKGDEMESILTGEVALIVEIEPGALNRHPWSVNVQVPGVGLRTVCQEMGVHWDPASLRWLVGSKNPLTQMKLGW